MYGSMAYGICSHDSGADIDIDYENHSKSSTQILKDVCDVIKKEMSNVFEPQQINKLYNSVSNGKGNKHQSLPNSNKITLVARKTLGNNQKIVFNFTSGLHATAYKTSMLIKAYFELDERVKLLAFSFRHIAKVNK